MLKRITLLLARSPDFPQGNSACGYEVTAPLDDEGHLDAAAWHEVKQLCRVRRFWQREDDQLGLLVHEAGGVHGASWKFDYDRDKNIEDETGYRLDTHQFIVGEYVSLRDRKGHSHTFRIAQIRPV
jgi:hypothetical protein